MGKKRKPRIVFQVVEVERQASAKDRVVQEFDTYEEAEQFIMDMADDMMYDPTYEIRKVFTYKRM